MSLLCTGSEPTGIDLWVKVTLWEAQTSDLSPENSSGTEVLQDFALIPRYDLTSVSPCLLGPDTEETRDFFGAVFCKCL